MRTLRGGAKMFCIYCGCELDDLSHFCGNCGTAIYPAFESAREKELVLRYREMKKEINKNNILKGE